MRTLFLGVIAYVVFLLATVPASLVAGQAAAATGGRVVLSQASGTLWSGSARASVSAPGVSLELEDLRWRFLPSRLPAGRIAFAIEARAGALRAELEAARSPLAWQVRDFRALGDASALPHLWPLAAAWQPAGAITLEAGQLSWDGRQASGTATAEWRDASLSLSPVRPLGSWRAQAVAEGTAARITLETLKGPLVLTGNGTFAGSGRLTMAGQARAEPGRERDLEAVLNLFGPRRADGTHPFEVR